MKSQKEAERAEQQRIKNLVLNYDLQDTADHDGISSNLYSQYFSNPNPNLPRQFPTKSSTTSTSSSVAHNHTEGLGGGEKHGTSHHQHNASLHQSTPNHAVARPNGGAGTNRGGQRARKLQLSDVDWYEKPELRPDNFSSSSTRGGGGRGSGRGRGRGPARYSGTNG